MAVELGIGTVVPINGVDYRAIRQYIFMFVQHHVGFRRIAGTIDDF